MIKNCSRCGILLLLILLLTVSTRNLSATADEKMKPEEILAKHLASIGTAEALAAIKTRMIVGKTRATFRGRGTGVTEGVAVLASEGEKNLIGMKFQIAEYPVEKMGYDGKSFSVGYVSPGRRSILGTFLLMHDQVFKQGIMGGTLSSSWPLLNFSGKEAKLEYAGLKKIGDKKLHEVKYLPRTGSDLKISLFFDMDTFQHVRTEYKRVVAANMGRNFPGDRSNSPAVDASANQRETRYTMVEEFSNYGQENALNLPHTYRLFLSIEATNGTTSYEWLTEMERFIFNQPIDSKEFDVDSY